jgi:hypothetical protein
LGAVSAALLDALMQPGSDFLGSAFEVTPDQNYKRLK